MESDGAVARVLRAAVPDLGGDGLLDGGEDEEAHAAAMILFDLYLM
jgi:hypothetical protein